MPGKKPRTALGPPPWHHPFYLNRRARTSARRRFRGHRRRIHRTGGGGVAAPILAEAVVVLLEAGQVGAGASGRTGGMALAETAAGNLPGLGDVLAGLRQTLHTLEIDCDLTLKGAWEIARKDHGHSARLADRVAGFRNAAGGK